MDSKSKYYRINLHVYAKYIVPFCSIIETCISYYWQSLISFSPDIKRLFHFAGPKIRKPSACLRREI